MSQLPFKGELIPSTVLNTDPERHLAIEGEKETHVIRELFTNDLVLWTDVEMENLSSEESQREMKRRRKLFFQHWERDDTPEDLILIVKSMVDELQGFGVHIDVEMVLARESTQDPPSMFMLVKRIEGNQLLRYTQAGIDADFLDDEVFKAEAKKLIASLLDYFTTKAVAMETGCVQDAWFFSDFAEVTQYVYGRPIDSPKAEAQLHMVDADFIDVATGFRCLAGQLEVLEDTLSYFEKWTGSSFSELRARKVILYSELTDRIANTSA